MHDTLHIDTGGDDVIRIDGTGLDQILDLGDGHLARGRHHRIEVARGLAIDEVAFGVAFPGMYDREVGDDAALHDVLVAAKLALFLALGDHRPRASAREEGRDTGAARANALSERALRVELDLQLPGEILLREGLVLSDI